MTKISDRLNRLSESATLAMARMSRELKAEGNDIIALSLGEPDFNTPNFIKEAAKKGHFIFATTRKIKNEKIKNVKWLKN